MEGYWRKDAQGSPLTYVAFDPEVREAIEARVKELKDALEKIRREASRLRGQQSYRDFGTFAFRTASDAINRSK